MFGIILAALLVSLAIMQVILLDRYLLVVTGLLIFFIAFFISKEQNTYITIGICMIILVMSSFNCYYTIKENYSNNNQEVIDFAKENIKEEDLLLTNNELTGFVIMSRFKNNPKVFYDEYNWQEEKAYQAFGPNFSVIYDLEKLQDYARKNLGYG